MSGRQKYDPIVVKFLYDGVRADFVVLEQYNALLHAYRTERALESRAAAAEIERLRAEVELLRVAVSGRGGGGIAAGGGKGKG